MTAGPWILRIVQADGSGPAPGVPVTVFDDHGDAVTYLVSDRSGLVDVPVSDARTLRLRLGLRSEAPTDIETARFVDGPVQLLAPRTFPMAQPRASSAGERTPALRVSAATVSPITPEHPGHVLRFSRLAILPRVTTSAARQLGAGAERTGVEVSEGAPVDFFSAPDNAPAPLRYGAILEIEQHWQPLGHLAGDLLYSLALAPGEEARAAIVDRRWSGAETGERPLQQIARRLGALDPVTVLPDAAGSLAAGLVHAAADTVKWLHERAAGAGDALREAPLHVSEVHGDPPAGASLRIVRNSQTDRPVTYHFYEPLQRFRVTARGPRIRPAVFVPFTLPNLALRSVVRQFGYLIRQSLHDRTLLAELDGLLGLGSHEGAEWERSGVGPPVSELRIVVEPQPATPPADLRQVFCFLRSDAARYTVHFFPAQATRGLATAGAIGTNHWIGAIRLADFHLHPLRYPGNLSLENASRANIVFKSLHLDGRVGDGWRRLLTIADIAFPAQSQIQLASLSALVSASGIDARDSRLLAHLGANLPHYSAAIIAGGDPAARYNALAKVGDAEGRPLADLIENTVVGTVGTYIAFALRSPEFAPAGVREALEQLVTRPPRAPDEVVVTLPQPGVWLSAQAGAAIEGMSAPIAESPPASRRGFRT